LKQFFVCFVKPYFSLSDLMIVRDFCIFKQDKEDKVSQWQGNWMKATTHHWHS